MSKKDDALTRSAPAARVRPSEDEARIEVGQWYWVASTDQEADSTKSAWLGCVTRIGSNYVKLEGPANKYVNSTFSERIHLDEFEKRCTPEADPESYLRGKVEAHQRRVNELLNDIKQLTAKLGISPLALTASSTLDAAASAQALTVVHGTQDVKQYKADLVKAKEKTLPELFKQVEHEHEMMAHWMKASLIPFQAQAKGLERHTEAIKDRIFIVELYAGLCETLVQIRDGDTAEASTKLSLFQRRHYMDEECLANYEAGGMSFQNIDEFNEWLLRPENLQRILPYPRSVVAFRVRHWRYDYEGNDQAPVTIWQFIRLWSEEKANAKTYLYFRNGEQVFYLATGIEFGEQLFPDREHAELEGKDLWVELGHSSNSRHIKAVVTTAHVEFARQCWRDKLRAYRDRRREHRKAHAVWEALTDAQKEETHEPWFSHYLSETDKPRFEPLTPESVYYDDAMKMLNDQIKEHNRVATVLQGVLDRSPAFHPHPPWQLFTREGFETGINLIYDQTRALTSGDAPDFEAYRAQCNKNIRAGSLTIGQDDFWQRAEAVKENKRRENDWRSRRDYSRDLVRYHPCGNPGPGRIARVVRVMRNGDCIFEWTRERQRYRYYSNENEKPIRCRIRVPCEKLFNVDAYTPGDFHIFFDDPRTRADYVKWAPFLLAAEDYVVKRRQKWDDDDENEYEK